MPAIVVCVWFNGSEKLRCLSSAAVVTNALTPCDSDRSLKPYTSQFYSQSPLDEDRLYGTSLIVTFPIS